MKKFTWLVCACLTCYNLTAQNYYSFQKSQDTYSYLQGATILTNTFQQSSYDYIIPNGFRVFNKNLPDTISVLNNGQMLAVKHPYSFQIAPFFNFLEPAGAGSSLSAKIENAGGDSILKIQWKNMKVYGMPQTDSFNFQLWLYKSSQNVEFHYGPSHISDPSAVSAHVFLYLLQSSFCTKLEAHTIKGNPTNAVDDSSLTAQNELDSAFIPNGTVFRFKFSPLSVSPLTNERLIQAYPNPTNNVIILQLPDEAPANVDLTNTYGQILTSKFCRCSQLKFDLRELPPGFYFLRVHNGSSSHQVMVQKL